MQFLVLRYNSLRCFHEEHLASQTSPVRQRCTIDTDTGEAVTLPGAVPVHSDTYRIAVRPACGCASSIQVLGKVTLPSSEEKQLPHGEADLDGMPALLCELVSQEGRLSQVFVSICVKEVLEHLPPGILWRYVNMHLKCLALISLDRL